LESSAKINKIIKFSNVDGPGNRMAIFFQGCNINCKYCHNPETINICNLCGICVSKCPKACLKIEDGRMIWDEKNCIDCDICIKSCPRDASPKVRELTVKELAKEIKKVSPFLRGVTFSGGEATLWSEFIVELVEKLKKETKLDFFIDTNGIVDLSLPKYERLIEVVDSFMLDLKASSSKAYEKLASHSSDMAFKNLEFLKKIGKLYEVRTVIYDREDSLKTVEKTSKLIENSEVIYKLISYREIGVRDEVKSFLKEPDDKLIEKAKEICIKNRVKNIVVIWGLSLSSPLFIIKSW